MNDLSNNSRINNDNSFAPSQRQSTGGFDIEKNQAPVSIDDLEEELRQIGDNKKQKESNLINLKTSKQQRKILANNPKQQQIKSKFKYLTETIRKKNMFTKSSQLLYLTREDNDQFGEPKGLNICLRVPFHPFLLSSNWIITGALFCQCLMQTVCFGLIDEIKVDAVYDATVCLGFNCLFLFLSIMQINLFVCCNGTCGDNTEEFDEKRYKLDLEEYYQKGQKQMAREYEEDQNQFKFNTLMRYVLYRKMMFVYFVIQILNVPFVLGVVMTLFHAKYDMQLEDIDDT